MPERVFPQQQRLGAQSVKRAGLGFSKKQSLIVNAQCTKIIHVPWLPVSPCNFVCNITLVRSTGAYAYVSSIAPCSIMKIASADHTSIRANLQEPKAAMRVIRIAIAHRMNQRPFRTILYK